MSISNVLSVVEAETRDYDRKARQIIDATGVKGGLIMHLGCGDGKLTAALGADESYLVHGLDTDAQAVWRARRNIRELEMYGSVSVERFDGKRLLTGERSLVTADHALHVLEIMIACRESSRIQKSVLSDLFSGAGHGYR